MLNIECNTTMQLNNVILPPQAHHPHNNNTTLGFGATLILQTLVQRIEFE